MKLKLPRRRVWRVAIYLGALFLVLIAIDLVLIQVRRNIHPGYETTRIVAPLQPDGSIDYLTAIDDYFSRGVTRENNAVPIVLLALGREALPKNQPEDGITDRLGMPHLPEMGDYFVVSDKFRKQHGATDEALHYLDMSKPLAGPVELDVITKQWIAANEKPLATMAQILTRPRFFFPLYGGKRLETLPETLLPYLNKLTDVNRALRLRAMIRLHDGNVDGFREDLRLMHHFARLLSQHSTLIGRLVAFRIESAACQAMRLGLATSKMSAEQLNALASTAQSLGELPSMIDGLNVCERYMALDTMSVFARQGPRRTAQLLNLLVEGGIGASGFLRFMPIDHEQAMRNINRLEDATAAALLYPTHPQRMAALELLERELPQYRRISPFDVMSSKWPTQMFTPHLTNITKMETAAHMERGLTQVALRLAIYHAKNNAYPASLIELGTGAAVDLFTETPLIYAKTGNGYTLYSVGPNMKDDSGQADDLAVTVLSRSLSKEISR